MKKSWIVIADAGRAVIMGKFDESDRISVVRGLDNPSGRQHTSELVSDQSGRMEKKQGCTRSAMDPHTEPHEKQAINFAHHICQIIEDGANNHKFDQFILIAPPHFLGLLKSTLGAPMQKSLVMCQAKDFAHATLEELDQYVRELLVHPELVEMK